MITDWLGAMPRETFLQEHFHKAPLAQPRSARRAIPFLQWETLDAILDQGGAEGFVAKQGALSREELPKSSTEFRALFADGNSVVVRRAEDHDARLRFLADSFAQELDAPVTIQLFATPAGYHGFGWHYDVEDVFLALTDGRKEYFLRQNTVNPVPTIDNVPADMQYEKETSPTMAATLITGDWLYIPSGWWHVGRSHEHSLSLSVGVLSARARKLA